VASRGRSGVADGRDDGTELRLGRFREWGRRGWRSWGGGEVKTSKNRDEKKTKRPREGKTWRGGTLGYGIDYSIPRVPNKSIIYIYIYIYIDLSVHKQSA